MSWNYLKLQTDFGRAMRLENPTTDDGLCTASERKDIINDAILEVVKDTKCLRSTTAIVAESEKMSYTNLQSSITDYISLYYEGGVRFNGVKLDRKSENELDRIYGGNWRDLDAVESPEYCCFVDNETFLLVPPPLYDGRSTPTGLAVTATGTTGATTYSYRISAVDDDTGETLACTAVAITDGNATLSATNYNALAWTAVSGADHYNIYGRTSGAERYMTQVDTNSYNDTLAVVTPSGQPKLYSTANTILVSYVQKPTVLSADADVPFNGITRLEVYSKAVICKCMEIAADKATNEEEAGKWLQKYGLAKTGTNIGLNTDDDYNPSWKPNMRAYRGRL